MQGLGWPLLALLSNDTGPRVPQLLALHAPAAAHELIIGLVRYMYFYAMSLVLTTT